jgi:hypothetical protein
MKRKASLPENPIEHNQISKKIKKIQPELFTNKSKSKRKILTIEKSILNFF